ncbi:MAG TPA: anhydro-N-acetylmuramic acid kinase [Puia sp.]|nr:anhydro-N-acetylmuramic acid kinase [Puia sp.]
MVYKVIGLMSGSSLDGLDIAYVHLQESAATSKDSPRKWAFEFLHTACYPYTPAWKQRLAAAADLSARDYQLLHTEYGHYLGERVNEFIETFHLQYQVQLIASHGHTSFHMPARKMTAQLGDGAALAATTKINVVSDLRAMDLALGGQGAPIVPIGEKLLLYGYDLFLNLGGIANISRQGGEARAVAANEGPGAASGGGASLVADPGAPATGFVAYDVCPANRVLNQLAATVGKEYDEGGALAAAGRVDEPLLRRLNDLPYYEQAYPKSLGNEFGTEIIYPIIAAAGLSTADALRTYVEHIALQIRDAVAGLVGGSPAQAGQSVTGRQMLVTGGGAHNHFLIGRLRELLDPLNVEVVVPSADGDKDLIDYKESLVMALIGVLRWREENNVLASVTGASRDSIGGAVWIGQEA